MKKNNIIWSKKVRFFHWANAVSVLSLLGLGLIISDAVSIIGWNPADQLIESLIPYHIGIGAFFLSLLCYRIFTMFNTSDRGESIDEINPLSKENINQLKKINKEKEGHSYKYHNPVGRFMVAAWFVVLSFQGITGTILSYQHLTEKSEISISSAFIPKAYAHGSSHHEAMESLGSNKENTPMEEDSILIEAHEITMYLIIFMLFAHVGGVLKESLRIKTNLIKKMIHGK